MVSMAILYVSEVAMCSAVALLVSVDDLGQLETSGGSLFPQYR